MATEEELLNPVFDAKLLKALNECFDSSPSTTAILIALQQHLEEQDALPEAARLEKWSCQMAELEAELDR
jgi:hypothetical protein